VTGTRLVLLAMGAVVAGAGCELTLPGADDGGDAATDAPAQTVGEQCATIVTEFCKQWTGPCGGAATASLADCINNDMPTCCAGSACNAVSPSSAAAVATCTAAIDVEDCNSVMSLGLPAACQGVPLED